jgi:hypothetical protein
MDEVEEKREALSPGSAPVVEEKMEKDWEEGKKEETKELPEEVSATSSKRERVESEENVEGDTGSSSLKSQRVESEPEFVLKTATPTSMSTAPNPVQYQYPYAYAGYPAGYLAPAVGAYPYQQPYYYNYTPQHTPQPPPGAAGYGQAAPYMYQPQMQQYPGQYGAVPAATTWFCAFCSSTNQLSELNCPKCGSSGASQGAVDANRFPKRSLKTNPNLPKLDDQCKFFHGPRNYCARGEDCRFAH